MRTFLAVTAFIAMPAVGAAQAAPDSFRLGPIVVTATRLDTPLAAAPGTITVLTRAELQARGIRSVADALRVVPGVAVAQSAGPGSLTSVFIRGGESDYVQVLVDGVQVNDPGGAYNWAHLRAEDIERIEIVRGPASVLYGSDAAAGVVQIFTRSGGAPRIEASVTGDRGERRTGGAFYTRSYDASVTGSTSPTSLRGATLRYGATAAHTNADGLYEYNSDYDNSGLSARAQLVASRFDVAISGRLGDNEYHFPTSGSGAVVDRNQFATGDTRSLGLDAGFRVAAPLELRVLAATHDFDSRTDNPPDAPGGGSFVSETEQMRRSVDVRVNGYLPRNLVLTVGIEREDQHAATAFESVSAFGTFADTTDNSRDNSGFYAQLHGTPRRNLAATLGARVDDNSAFGTFTTGRLAVSWTPAAATRLHAAAGTAFKEPTFFENFATGFARGNPDLDPEQTRSWEIGAQHGLRAGAIMLGATWFDQRFNNLIQFTFTPATPGDPNYFNVGKARARGLELTAHGERDALSTRASYTFTSTAVTDEGLGSDPSFQQDAPLLRRPRHQAALGVGYGVSDALRFQLDARFVGERADLDFTSPTNFSGTRVTLPSYTAVDGGVSYAVLHRGSRTVGLSLRARNLFAAEYEEIFNFRTEGRVLQLGLRIGS